MKEYTINDGDIGLLKNGSVLQIDEGLRLSYEEGYSEKEVIEVRKKD